MFGELLKEVVDTYTKTKNVAIFLIRRLRGERLEEIRRQFGITKYSSVSSAIEKMKREISADRRLKTRVKNIEKNIIKQSTADVTPFLQGANHDKKTIYNRDRNRH